MRSADVNSSTEFAPSKAWARRMNDVKPCRNHAGMKARPANPYLLEAMGVDLTRFSGHRTSETVGGEDARKSPKTVYRGV